MTPEFAFSDDDDNFSDVPDAEGEDLLEKEDNGGSCVFSCPLTRQQFATKQELTAFLETTFHVTLERIVQEQSPLPTSSKSASPEAFFYYCILINHLRSLQVDDPASWPKILQDITPESSFWKLDSLLVPVIPDDPLIRSFGAWDSCDDDDSTDDELHADPYAVSPPAARFAVEGEVAPSREFLTEQARNLRELGAFD